MDPGSMALAAGSLFVDGMMQDAANAKTHQRSLDMQNRQFAHAEHMYRNRHQWQVEDLLKAGLNPVLSATGGAPVGATPSQPSHPVAPLTTNTANQAMQALNTSKEMTMLSSQKAHVDSQTAQNSANVYQILETVPKTLDHLDAMIDNVKEDSATKRVLQDFKRTAIYDTLSTLSSRIGLNHANTQNAIASAQFANEQTNQIKNRPELILGQVVNDMASGNISSQTLGTIATIVSTIGVAGFLRAIPHPMAKILTATTAWRSASTAARTQASTLQRAVQEYATKAKSGINTSPSPHKIKNKYSPGFYRKGGPDYRDYHHH